MAGGHRPGAAGIDTSPRTGIPGREVPGDDVPGSDPPGAVAPPDGAVLTRTVAPPAAPSVTAPGPGFVRTDLRKVAGPASDDDDPAAGALAARWAASRPARLLAGWLGPAQPYWLDAVLCAGLAGLGLIGYLAADVHRPELAALLLVAQCVPVLARRHAPLLALVPAVAATALQQGLLGLLTGASLVILVLLADIARRCRYLLDLAAVGVLAAGVLSLTLLHHLTLEELLLVHIGLVGALVVGDGAGRRVRERAYRVEREDAIARTTRAEAAAAMAEQRVRIARELHDLSAHTFGVIAVQAQAARRAVESRPQKARTSLDIVLDVVAQAADDVRRTVGFLRAEDSATAPQPTLDDLDTLVERMAQVGLGVVVRREQSDEGPAAAPWSAQHGVPSPALQASAYRIIEEALLNTVRHAGAHRAEVTVRRTPGWLLLDVVDGGRGADPDSREGQGLVGMRERVAVFGGRLHAGNEPGGGFRVHAELGTAGGFG